MRALEIDRPRNHRLVDWWSLTHIVWGAGLAFLVGPFWALAVMTLWEPFEVLLLSPLLARRGRSFGHESLANSLTDLVFNLAGVLAGAGMMAAMGRVPVLSVWP